MRTTQVGPMVEARPGIGLLTLMFKLYDAIPELEPEMAEFARELTKVLGRIARVEWPGVCKTRDQVDDAISLFEEKEVDLIVVVLLTYAPSHLAVHALNATRLPVLIFNTQKLREVTQDMDPRDLIRNHGMHGVQDLANVLSRAERKFSLVTGRYEDPQALGQVEEWCRAARAVRFLKKCRVGIIGHPLEQMGDFALDETMLLTKLGVEVRHVPQKDLADAAKNAPAKAIKDQIQEDRLAFRVAKDVTREEHEESSRLEWAIRETLKAEGMQAFTANFMAVPQEGWLQTLPFLASSKMLSEGYGYAGEGDVLTSVAVAMMQRLAGSASFTEMFTMDFGGGAILMSHMGEGNHALARQDRPVELVGSELGLVALPKRPLLLRFALRPGPATLVNLTIATKENLKIIAAEGEVVDFAPIEGVMTPHFKIKPKRPLAEFLTGLSLEGSSHHFALAYGNWSSMVAKVADLVGAHFAKV